MRFMCAWCVYVCVCVCACPRVRGCSGSVLPLLSARPIGRQLSGAWGPLCVQRLAAERKKNHEERRNQGWKVDKN
jgi:hypothetical protein